MHLGSDFACYPSPSPSDPSWDCAHSSSRVCGCGLRPHCHHRKKNRFRHSTHRKLVGDGRCSTLVEKGRLARVLSSHLGCRWQKCGAPRSRNQPTTREGKYTPFDFFFPIPSLSITSSPHLTRLFSTEAPLSLRVPSGILIGR